MKPNMANAMRQVQKMQADMARVQDELKEERVEASVGGGAVKVVMTGELQVESVTIDPGAIDPAEADMLQDMIAAAVNEALRQAQDLVNKRMAAVTGPLAGGLGLPPGMF
jgi:nucleoid-associated protein EbfC